MATNKQLVKALAAAKATPSRTVKPPPGFAANANMTGHTTNALGDACPTKKWKPDGRWMFVTKQYCKTCNNMVNHILADCPELEGNEHIKAEMAAVKARKRGKRVTIKGETNAGE